MNSLRHVVDTRGTSTYFCWCGLGADVAQRYVGSQRKPDAAAISPGVEAANGSRELIVVRDRAGPNRRAVFRRRRLRNA